MKHVSLYWNVDFDNEVIDGSALLNFEVLKDIKELVMFLFIIIFQTSITGGQGQ